MARSKKNFDRVAESYDETRGGMRRGRRLAADLNPHFSTRGKVFEVGVGTGVVALGLQELGRWVGGIDIGAEMTKHANERIGPRVAVADAHRLPIKTRSLSDAYAVWVMHLVDVQVVMAEVARVLRLGGRFLVSQGQKRDPTPVDLIEAEMYSALSGDENRPRVSKQITDGAEQVGLSLLSTLLGDPEPYGVTPVKAARRIDERTKSALWDVDDLRWRTIVEPAIAQIRALPQPEVRIMGTTRARIWVFEK